MSRPHPVRSCQCTIDTNHCFPHCSFRFLCSFSTGSRGPWGPGPPAPKIFFKSCNFQAILREKPLSWANFRLRAPLGVKTLLGPPDQNPGSAPEFSPRFFVYKLPHNVDCRLNFSHFSFVSPHVSFSSFYYFLPLFLDGPFFFSCLSSVSHSATLSHTLSLSLSHTQRTLSFSRYLSFSLSLPVSLSLSPCIVSFSIAIQAMLQLAMRDASCFFCGFVFVTYSHAVV